MKLLFKYGALIILSLWSFLLQAQSDTLTYFDLQSNNLEVGMVYSLDKIDFQLNSDKLRPSSFPELNEVADFLKNHPNLYVEIENHLWTWSDEYSTPLSDNQAKSIQNYLISQGVNPNQITSKGYYDTQPYQIREKDLLKYPFLEIGKYLNIENTTIVSDDEYRKIKADLNNRNVIRITKISPQKALIIPFDINDNLEPKFKHQFDESLESFFTELEKGIIPERMISSKQEKLTRLVIEILLQYETLRDSISLKSNDKKLINRYTISENEYFLSVSFKNPKSNSANQLYYIINLIATFEDGKFTYSIPIEYLTRYWKTQTIGNITYHFRDKINQKRAQLFDEKNTLIARKFSLKPEKFDFYMTDNFQEILPLLGIEYSLSDNGNYRDGFGPDSNTVFAIMNNEDFSHDIFHYYSAQINIKDNRNWIAEEGIAYLWGNAYYTDKNGKMITLDSLVMELRKYLKENHETDLFQLFHNNVPIFKEIAKEISLRSTISGIIAKEVELKYGMQGMLKLINSGSENRLESYLKVTDELLGINKETFNEKVKVLIDKY